MGLAESISDHVRKLPEHSQAQVLDFVAYLEKRNSDLEARAEDTEWSSLSLSAAMSDMVHEDGPEYTVDDVKETV